MKIKELAKNKKTLKNYFNMLYPFELEKDEYVRILVKGRKRTTPYYVKSFEEFYRTIEENMGADIYTNLSTVIRRADGSIDGKKDCMYKRYVLFFDYDMKNYPKAKDAEYFTKKFKEKTGLFIHMLVDSGHGFHFYVCTEPSDSKTVAQINKKLVKLVGADINAAHVTQLARVPTTINHKGKEKKRVNVVFDGTMGKKFYRYTIDKVRFVIKKVLQREKLKLETKKELDERKAKRGEPKCNYSCIKSMVENGADKGQRNKCLGLIINAYRDSGYSKEDILQVCLEFNNKCRPRKDEKIIISDFERFWNKGYKMFKCLDKLGPDDWRRGILQNFCCREQCAAKEYYPPDRRLSFRIPYAAFDDPTRMNLKGVSYIILSVICRYGDGETHEITQKKLEQILTFRGKSLFCKSTITKHLNLLEREKLISISEMANTNDRLISCMGIEDEFEGGWLHCANIALDVAIRKAIQSNDFKVYLMMLFRLKNKMSVAQEQLSEWSGVDKSTLSKCIKRLSATGSLEVYELPSYKGGTYKYYRFVFRERKNTLLYNG